MHAIDLIAVRVLHRAPEGSAVTRIHSSCYIVCGAWLGRVNARYYQLHDIELKERR